MKAKEAAQYAFNRAYDFFLAGIYTYGRRPSAFQLYNAWRCAEQQIVSGLDGYAFDNPEHLVNDRWNQAVNAEMKRLYDYTLELYRIEWEKEEKTLEDKKTAKVFLRVCR